MVSVFKVVIGCYLFALILSLFHGCRCASVRGSVRITVLFAGSLPLFMQDETWTSDGDSMQTLSELLTSAAQEASADKDSVNESPYGYDYILDAHYVTEDQMNALSDTLATALDKSRNALLNGPEIADRYVAILLPLLDSLRNRDSGSHAHAFLLLHDPVKLGDRTGFSYGYVAGRDGHILETGLAQRERFIFLDTAARPHLFKDRSGPSIAEKLMSVSSDISAYAKELVRLALHLFVQPQSSGVMPFPPEETLVFDFFFIDLSEIGQSSLLAEQNNGTVKKSPVAASIDIEQFQRWLMDAFEHRAYRPKVKVAKHVVDLRESVSLSMNILRAFRRSALHLILESDILMRGLAQNSILKEKSLFNVYSDASFTVHVPVLLFSFADHSRAAHFSDGETVRVKVFPKRAIAVLENRFRNRFEDRQDATALALKGALQLFGGLSSSVLSMLDTSRASAPVLLKDTIRRRAVEVKLAWSQRKAVSPAEDLLRHDIRPSIYSKLMQDSEIQLVAKRTKSVLEDTLQAWNSAILDLDATKLDGATVRLENAVTELRALILERICRVSYFDKRAFETLSAGTSHTGDAISLFVFYVLFPALLGAAVACLQMRNNKKLHPTSSQRLTERETGRERFDPEASAGSEPVWFSTLSEKFTRRRLKPKLN